MRRNIFILVLVSLSSLCFGQPKVRGYFLEDSAEIGQEVTYVLVAWHQKDELLYFPDTSDDFGNVELHHSRWFPTEVIGDSVLYDSAHYVVQGFTIDAFFTLSLPVYWEKELGQRIPYFADLDSVLRKNIIDTLPAQPAVNAQKEFLPLAAEFNYPFVVGIVVLIMVMLLLLALAFGKRLLGAIVYIRLAWQHRSFERKWQQLLEKIKEEPESSVMESMISVWKGYAERLTGKPYRAWSSRELADHFRDGTMTRALKEVDRWVYGNLKPSDPGYIGNVLRQKATEMYKAKRKESWEKKPSAV